MPLSHSPRLAVTVVLLLGMSLPARAQAPKPVPARTYPSIPGGMDAPPAWLAADKNVPFDLKTYFAQPPASQNAAPLYLDALFEFGGELASCHAPGPETEARLVKARERTDRSRPLIDALNTDPTQVDRAAIAALLVEYQEGFRKLERAQARPRCVFVTGASLESLLPHVQAMRQVARVASLAVLPEFDQGRLEPGINNATALLRMARDLQPRGGLIVQLVSSAITNTTIEDLIKPVLRHPRVTTAQCDKVLTMLANHRKQAIDARSEALKAEYLLVRVALHDLADVKTRDQRVDLLVQVLGMPPDQARGLSEALKSATPDQFGKANASVDRACRELLAAAKAPYPDRAAKTTAVPEDQLRSSGPERLVGLLLQRLPEASEPLDRTEAALRATQGLAAVRRWQLVHKSLPTDLTAAFREARVTPEPTDPYTQDRPLKLVVIDHEPVVYSVGKDGQDNGGTTDNAGDSQPSDLTFRLTPARRKP